jgi:hypothetical protein
MKNLGTSGTKNRNEIGSVTSSVKADISRGAPLGAPFFCLTLLSERHLVRLCFRDSELLQRRTIVSVFTRRENYLPMRAETADEAALTLPTSPPLLKSCEQCSDGFSGGLPLKENSVIHNMAVFGSCAGGERDGSCRLLQSNLQPSSMRVHARGCC